MATERDTGEDKTDKQEDDRLAEAALQFQNRMPFYESEPDVPYAPYTPRVKEEKN